MSASPSRRAAATMSGKTSESVGSAEQSSGDGACRSEPFLAALGTGIEPGVLHGEAGSRGQRQHDLLVGLGELAAAALLGQIEVPVDHVTNEDRHTEERPHRRMAGREAVRRWVLAEVLEADRVRFSDQEPQDAKTAWQVTDHLALRLVDAHRDEVTEPKPSASSTPRALYVAPDSSAAVAAMLRRTSASSRCELIDMTACSRARIPGPSRAGAASDPSNGKAISSDYEDLGPLDTPPDELTLGRWTHIATLSRDECLRGLASHSLGRLAVTAHALPVIVPIHYSLVNDVIVFRALVDGMVARACDGSVVAFQVDNLGRDDGTQWSVLVVGLAALIAGSEALRARPIPPVTTPGNGPDQFVGITIGQITGSPLGAGTGPFH